MLSTPALRYRSARSIVWATGSRDVSALEHVDAGIDHQVDAGGLGAAAHRGEEVGLFELIHIRNGRCLTVGAVERHESTAAVA
ncbi:MAG: hypothetical protein L0K86_18245, partial [Actinomycetia bacterium]|nr:hypothetical protein [Actinomycetes bacterium]